VNLLRVLEVSHLQVALFEFLFKDQSLTSVVDVDCCERGHAALFAVIPGCQANRFLSLSAHYYTGQGLARGDYGRRFTIIEAAASDQDEVANLNVSSGHPPEFSPSSEWDYGNKSSSLLAPARLMRRIVPWLRFDSALHVSTVTLDRFASQQGVSAVDFIHIDVHGAELRAFSGTHLTPHRRDLGQKWLIGKSTKTSQPPSRSTAFLQEAGFKLVLRSVVDGFGDHLYVNPAFFPVSRKALP
jgi:FkbM family methyltransferase